METVPFFSAGITIEPEICVSSLLWKLKSNYQTFGRKLISHATLKLQKKTLKSEEKERTLATNPFWTDEFFSQNLRRFFWHFIYQMEIINTKKNLGNKLYAFRHTNRVD